MKTKLFVLAVAIISLAGCKKEPTMYSSTRFEYLSFAAEQVTVQVDESTTKIAIAALFNLQESSYTDIGYCLAPYEIDTESSTAVEGVHYKATNLMRKAVDDKNLYFDEIIGGNVIEPVTLVIKLTDKYPNPSKLPVIDKTVITLMSKK